MKTLLPGLFLVSVAFCAAASGDIEVDEFGWMTRERLDSFDSVDLRINADLTLTQGSDWEVKVRGDIRDLEELDIYITRGTLVIRRESVVSFLKPADLIEIRVTMPMLEKAALSSDGNIRTDGTFECRDLELSLAGSGSIVMEAISDDLQCEVAGSGLLEYRGNANRLTLAGTGSGNARIQARLNRADIRMTGSGRTDMTGITDLLEITISGSGSLSAGRLEARVVTAELSGSGNAEVQAGEELEARLTGSGSLRYSGNPAVTDFSVTGTGNIRGN